MWEGSGVWEGPGEWVWPGPAGTVVCRQGQSAAEVGGQRERSWRTPL